MTLGQLTIRPLETDAFSHSSLVDISKLEEDVPVCPGPEQVDSRWCSVSLISTLNVELEGLWDGPFIV